MELGKENQTPRHGKRRKVARNMGEQYIDSTGKKQKEIRKAENAKNVDLHSLCISQKFEALSAMILGNSRTFIVFIIYQRST